MRYSNFFEMACFETSSARAVYVFTRKFILTHEHLEARVELVYEHRPITGIQLAQSFGFFFLCLFFIACFREISFQFSNIRNPLKI